MVNEVKLKLSIEGGPAVNATMDSAAKGLDTIGHSSRNAQSHLSELTAQVTRFTGTLAGIASVQKAISAASDYSALTARMSLLEGGSNRAAASMQTVYDIALRQSAALFAVGDSYVKIDKVVAQLGGTAKDSAQIVETVAASLRVGNASVTESTSTMRQFGQAMAKGKLNGDEFVSLMENAPDLMDAVAVSLGKTKGELFAMAEAGELTARVFGDAVLASFDSMTKKAASLPQTVGQAMENVTTSFTRAAAESRVVGLASSAAMGSMAAAAGNASVILDSLATVALVAVTRSAMLAAVALKDKVAAMLAANAANVATLQATVASTHATVADTAAKGVQLQAGLAALAMSRAEVVAKMDATRSTIAQATAQLAASQAAGALSFALASAREATNTLTGAQARQAALMTELTVLGVQQAAVQTAITRASAAHTVATLAQTEAQLALNAATSLGTKLMGLLGGPIGLVTTVLSIGVSAWALWGSSAKDGEQKAAGAIEASTPEILDRINQQIERIERRNALAGMKVGVNGLDSTSAEADKLGALQIRIDQARAEKPSRQGEEGRMVRINALLAEQGLIQQALTALERKAAPERAVLQQKAMTDAMVQYAPKVDKATQAVNDMRKAHGALFTEADEKKVRASFATPKGASEAAKMALDAKTAYYEQLQTIVTSGEKRAQDELSAQHAAGQMSDAAYYAQKRDLAVSANTGLQALAQLEIAAVQKSGLAQKDKIGAIAKYNGELVKLKEDEKAIVSKYEGEMLVASAKAQREYAVAMGKTLGDSLNKTNGLDAETRALQLQTQAIGNQGIAIDSIATLLAREELAILGTALATTLHNKAIAEQNGLTQAQAKNFADTIEQLTALKNAAAGVAGASADKDVAQAGLDQAKRLLGDKAADPFKEWGVSLRDTFATAGDGLARMVDAMGALSESGKVYGREMAVINALRKEGGKDNIEAAAKNEQDLIKKTAKAQIGAYASMAGAAKGYFNEKSDGYRLLDGIEKTMRAVKLANMVATYAMESGLVTAFTGLFVTSKAVETGAETAKTGGSVVLAGTEASAWGITAVVKSLASLPFPFNLAAGAVTLAAVIALGAKMAGGGGGGAPSVSMDSFAAQAPNTGTGTVFGDAGAQSKSIENSLSALEGMARPELAFTSQMVALLRSINDGLAGTTNAILSSGFDLSGANFSGTSSASGGGIWGAIFGSSSSSTSVSDLGLAFKKQTVAEAARAVELQSYQVTRRDWSKSGFLGLGSKSGTDYSTSFADVDARVSESMSLVVQRMVAAVGAAGSKLGATPEQLAAMQGVDSGLGKVSLMGKTGDEVQQLLSAVFSAMGDNLAQAVMPSLGAFRKVGEGYLETLSKVAAGLDEATLYTDRLGIATVSLNDLKNKQGDVGAELVRQSITGAETVNGAISGIGDVIQNFSGAASDLASLYSSLVDVRIALVAMGYSAGVVTSDLLRGAGGMDALASGLSDFQSGFLSQSEQSAIKRAKMDAEFAKLGLATPATADAFKALVLGLKGGNAASQELLGRVLVLSGGMRDLADSVDDAAKAAAEALSEAAKISAEAITTLLQSMLDASRSAIDASIAAIAEGVAGQKTSVTDAYNTQAEAIKVSLATVGASISKLQSLSSSLKSTLDSMRISGSDGEYRVLAQAQIKAALATARSGGGLPLDGQLTSALATVSKPSEQLYSNFTDYARDFYTTANDIAALGDLTGAQLTADELTQKLLTTQNETLKAGFDAEIKRLDAVVTAAQTQVDGVTKMTGAITSLTDALATWTATLGATLSNTMATAFATIDANQSSGIDWPEFQKSFGSMASEATLRTLFKASDYNGDGHISQLEAINANTKNLLAVLSVSGAGGKSAGAGVYSGTTVAAAIDAMTTAGASAAQIIAAASANYGVTSSSVAQIAAVTGNTAIVDYQNQANAATALSQPTRDSITAQAMAIAAAQGISAERALYDYARANNINAATVDKLMGYPNGTSNSWASANGLPAFAGGGDHFGGARLVGENGPEIEVTGPSRIFSASQTRSMLQSGGANNEEVVAELRAMSKRLEKIEANTKATAGHTAGTDRKLARVIPGNAMITEVA
jgi:tape measure domain-containing protein